MKRFAVPALAGTMLLGLAAALPAQGASPVKASATAGKYKSLVQVTWSRYADETEVAGYRIYRGTTQYISQAKRIADVNKDTGSLNDYSAAQAIKYYYFVLPLDRHNKVCVDDNVSSDTYTRYSGQGYKWSSARFTASVSTVSVGGELPLYFILNDEYIRPSKVELTTSGSKERAQIVYYGGLVDDNDDHAYDTLLASGAFGYLKGLKDGTVYLRATHGTQSFMLTITVKMPSWKLYAPDTPDLIKDDYRRVFFKFNNRFEIPDLTLVSGKSVELNKWSIYRLEPVASGGYEKVFDRYTLETDNSFGCLWLWTTGRSVFTVGMGKDYPELATYEPVVKTQYAFNVRFFKYDAFDGTTTPIASANVDDMITWAVEYDPADGILSRDGFYYPYTPDGSEEYVSQIGVRLGAGYNFVAYNDLFLSEEKANEPYFYVIQPKEDGWLSVSGTIKGIPYSGMIYIDK